MAMSSWTRFGPSSTSTRTASVSHRPAPAASVSARWRSVESSSPPSTAATPPWAQRVADWDKLGLGQHTDPEPGSPVGPDGAAGQHRGRQADCSRQTGHPTSEHQDVELAGHRSRPGHEQAGPTGSRAGWRREKARAEGSRLSIRRTGPTVAAMSSRSGPSPEQRDAGSRSSACTTTA